MNEHTLLDFQILSKLRVVQPSICIRVVERSEGEHVKRRLVVVARKDIVCFA